MKVNNREFTVVIERGKDGYLIGSAPELPGCHSQAKTMPELMKRMQEVIELCLSEAKKPVASPPTFVGVRRIKVKLPHAWPAPG